MSCENGYCEIYPEQRNLDGAYFKVDRDGQELEVCFSDMTETERGKVLSDKGVPWLITLATHLADCLHKLGDALDVKAKR